MKVQARISKLDETLMNRKKPRRMRYSFRKLAPTQNQHVVWYLLDTRTVFGIRIWNSYLVIFYLKNTVLRAIFAWAVPYGPK